MADYNITTEQLQKEDSDEKSNIRRINDQAILLANIETIAKNEKQSRIPYGPLRIGIDSNTPENNINIVYNFKEFIESYGKLSPADMSNLVPFVEIYKIYPEEDNMLDFKIPFNNYYPLKAKESILSNGSDRGYQANLVNVEFVSQGKDTATMFLYNVKLNFIFDSVATIFNENSKYIELFNPPKKHVDKVRDANYKYYKLKLKFGWNLNDQYPENISSSLHPTELNKFVELSRSEIYINYIKHSLTINEDGSVSLSVEYIGTVDSEARDANNINVFESESIRSLKNSSNEIQESEKNIRDAYGVEIEIKKGDGDDDITIKTIKEGQEKSGIVPDTEIQNLKNIYIKKYASEKNSLNDLLDSLLKRISIQYGGFFSAIEIDKNKYDEVIEITEQYSKLGETERLAQLEEINRMQTDKNSTKLMTSENLRNLSKTLPQTPLELISNKYLNKAENVDGGDGNTLSKYMIRYFTFGTLLEAIQSMQSEYLIIATNCNINFGNELIGSKRFQDFFPEDYKLILNSGIKIDDSYVVIQNKVFSINIFDIPISLSTFKHWFLKNVTSQNLTSMTLINFLNLCVNDLLVVATRPDNRDYIPKQNIRFKYLFDQININTKNPILEKSQELMWKPEVQGNRIGNPTTVVVKPEELADSTSGKRLTLIDNNPAAEKISKKIIMFYCVPTFVSRKMDPKNDLESGIPHFFYGAANSLANKITFKDEAIPFYKEANIQSQVDRKPWTPGIFLRGKYNVVIETIGTVNFRLGSLFYVSPTFTGVIDPSEPIKYGIGGYFSLVSLKMSIESGKYITSLEGNWVATGTGEYTDLSHKGINLVKNALPLEYNEFMSVSEILSDKASGERAERIMKNNSESYSGYDLP